ncbi:hypothetical protein CYMTET_43052 [Cymbomonas tetramitiformis]|uniref:Uncharacterized protein n=1 Tax=Cymbomonas tetramitiformis TaxID=36881 RepID=A0AAE0F211_9CHLO|nr:hypothetical protein CYMTET_43052 [Cymbomonas tetramitiformis]
MFRNIAEQLLMKLRVRKSRSTAYLVDDEACVSDDIGNNASASSSEGNMAAEAGPAPQRVKRVVERHPYEFLVREKLEKGLRYQSFTIDTRDHEDHTFCGVMCDLRSKSLLPMDYIEVHSVWIRGGLGEITIWYTEDTYLGKHECGEMWTRVYKGHHEESMDDLVQITLNMPIKVSGGKGCGLYVHSTLDGDQAIVYDNQRNKTTYDDDYLTVLPGLAHLSNIPFGKVGYWGRSHAWRRRREFVGRLSYGCRWLKWNPEVHLRFPEPFQKVALTLICGARRPESSLYDLEEPLIFYILNKCGWDWFGRQPSKHAIAQQEKEATQDFFGHGMKWRQYDDNYEYS